MGTMSIESNPARFVRKTVFKMTQKQLGELIGVSQGAVKKYEQKGRFSANAQEAILTAADQKGITFNPAWFFEVPSDPVAAE